MEEKPLGRIQKISGPRLHASWLNYPHVTQFDEADITEIEQRRKKLKEAAAAQEVKLTPLAFIIKAVVIALKEFPLFNTSMAESGDKLVWKQYFNVGFAADTPNGLVVPVIADADLKDVMSIAKELGELSAKAREGKIAAKEMQGGTFTVSSLGGIGGTHFTPIINAPEVAILGVGRADYRPVWQGRGVRAAPGAAVVSVLRPSGDRRRDRCALHELPARSAGRRGPRPAGQLSAGR